MKGCDGKPCFTRMQWDFPSCVAQGFSLNHLRRCKMLYVPLSSVPASLVRGVLMIYSWVWCLLKLSMQLNEIGVFFYSLSLLFWYFQGFKFAERQSELAPKYTIAKYWWYTFSSGLRKTMDLFLVLPPKLIVSGRAMYLRLLCTVFINRPRQCRSFRRYQLPMLHDFVYVRDCVRSRSPLDNLANWC